MGTRVGVGARTVLRCVASVLHDAAGEAAAVLQQCQPRLGDERLRRPP